MTWKARCRIVTITALVLAGSLAAHADGNCVPGSREPDCCLDDYLEHVHDCVEEFGPLQERVERRDLDTERDCAATAVAALRDCGHLLGPGPGEEDDEPWVFEVLQPLQVEPRKAWFAYRDELRVTIPEGAGGKYELVLLNGIPAWDDRHRVLPDAPPAYRGTDGTIRLDDREVVASGTLPKAALTRVPLVLEEGEHSLGIRLRPPRGGEPYAQLAIVLVRTGE